MAAAADAAAAGGSAAPPPPEQPHRPAAPPPAADRNQAGNPLDAGHPMSRRWVPAPGVHGLPPGAAALAHVNVSACHPYLGGELMVSSLVAASPQACLAALLPAPAAAAAGGVSILGPAAAVTLLAEPHPGCQLLHLRLAPPGAPSSISSSSSSGGAWSYWLRQLAAPREAVVQLSRSDDAASGISCVLFSSLPDGQARELLARRRRCEPSSSSSMQPAAGAAPVSPWPSQQHHHHHHHHHRHSWQLGRSLRAAVAAATPRWLTGSSSSSNSGGSGGSGCQLGSWLWRPVLVHVAGGFTVGGLSSSSSSSSGSNGCRAAAAGETLVTQLIKVDLRGWLCQPAAAAVGSSSSSSWLGRLGQGATDQLLQGMLSAVPVLKAQLEGQQQQQQQDREPHASGGGMQQRGAAGAAAVSGSCQPGTLVGALHGLLGGLLPWRWARGRGGASGSCSQAGVGAAEASAVSQAAAIAAEPEACRQLSQAGLSLVGVDANWQPLLGQCDPAFWSELHQPGGPAPFKVRGASYLTDRAKVAPGPAAFSLLAVDLVTTPSAVSHVARFLPAVRRSRASACFVANMMVPQPGSVLNLVMTFGSRRPWPRQGCSSGSSSSGSAASGSMHGSASSSSVGSASSSSATQSQQADGGWSAFDAALHRFVSGDDATRAGMLKMIPHVEAGPWLLRQSVGTTPFIVGRKLATRCFVTPRYVEVDIDVTTCQAAAYIVSSIRGMTTSLTIDLAFVLEGQRPQELPERLLGAVRFSGLDMAAAAPLDVGSEVPEWPAPWQGCGGSSGGGGCTTRAAPAGA